MVIFVKNTNSIGAMLGIKQLKSDVKEVFCYAANNIIEGVVHEIVSYIANVAM